MVRPTTYLLALAVYGEDMSKIEIHGKMFEFDGRSVHGLPNGYGMTREEWVGSGFQWSAYYHSRYMSINGNHAETLDDAWEALGRLMATVLADFQEAIEVKL